MEESLKYWLDYFSSMPEGPSGYVEKASESVARYMELLTRLNTTFKWGEKQQEPNQELLTGLESWISRETRVD